MKFTSNLDYQNDGVWIATLYMYILSVIFNFGILVSIAYLFKRLPQRFANFAVVSTSCMLFAITGLLFSYITVNSTQECTVNRVITYSVRYIGFFVFDLLQVTKIIAIISSVEVAQSYYFLYFILGVRFASYSYNGIFVTRVVLYNADNGLGPCQTVFSNGMIYQEHLVSVIFEVVLFLHLAWYIYQSCDNMATFDMIKSIADFEIYTFGVYLIAEIIYVSIFAKFSASNVALYNIFYFDLPTALFLANALNIISKRKAFSHMSAKKVYPIASIDHLESQISL